MNESPRSTSSDFEHFSENDVKRMCPLAHASKRYSALTALRTGSENVTYAELDDYTQCIASRVKEFLPKGMSAFRAGILSTNSKETIALFFALQRLGGSPVLLNKRLMESDWSEHLRRAKGALLLTGDRVSLTSKNFPPVVTVSKLLRDTKPSETRKDLLPASSNEEACVIFTSGSSGKAKGVRLGHEALHLAALGSNQFTGLSAGDSWLLSLPLYHVGGLGIVYRCLLSGASMVTTPGESAELLAAEIRRQPITHLSLVPTQLEELLDVLPPDEFLQAGIKCVLLAGAPSSPRLLKKIAEHRIPVLSCYGMTETGSHFTCVEKHLAFSKLHTVGVPLPGIELRITEQGVLEVKGKRLMLGYLEEAFEQDFRSPWFSTGDIVSVDESGYISITGRTDGMFISGGENIYPAEIENAALGFEGVSTAVVVPMKHSKWGHRPVLLVEAKVGASLLGDSLGAHLASLLPKFKCPDKILLVEKIPRTFNGKIARSECQKLVSK